MEMLPFSSSRVRALCPYLRGMSREKLHKLSRSLSVASGGQLLLARAKQCPVMSQSIAQSNDGSSANETLGGASASTMQPPHPVSRSWVERHGGVCPVGGHTLSVNSKRSYTTQSFAPKASMVMFDHDNQVEQAAPTTTLPPYQKRTPGSGLGPLPEPVAKDGPGFDFERFYHDQLKTKHEQNTYRYFNNINRLAERAPMGHLTENEGHEITVWCSNDYQNMSRHPRVIAAMKKTLEKYGAGAGGTRNIAGHNMHVEHAEEVLARLHTARMQRSCLARAMQPTTRRLQCWAPSCRTVLF